MNVWVSLAWCRSVSSYPSRFGKLAGMFYNLLEEANLPPARVEHWKKMLRAIDTHIAPGHNGPQFKQTDNGIHNATKEGEALMDK